jgi:hypothetical protein
LIVTPRPQIVCDAGYGQGGEVAVAAAVSSRRL